MRFYVKKGAVFFFVWSQPSYTIHKRWVALIEVWLRSNNCWYCNWSVFTNASIQDASRKTAIRTETFVCWVYTCILPQLRRVCESHRVHTVNIELRVVHKSHRPAQLNIKRVQRVILANLGWKLHAVTSVEHICPRGVPQAYIWFSLPHGPTSSF